MDSMRHMAATLLLACLCVSPHVVRAQGSAFMKLDFGGAITVEVPRNWTYQDENLRRHLNTLGEATTRLAGITPNPGENIILVAGNAFTSFQTASATIRLSIRRGESPTQANVRELSKASRSELLQLLDPVITESHKAMMNIGLVKSIKTLDAQILSNHSLHCMFYESEALFSDSTKLLQTYICPMGDKSIKLTTSFRKSEAALFRPVLQHVWSSLRVK